MNTTLDLATLYGDTYDCRLEHIFAQRCEQKKQCQMMNAICEGLAAMHDIEVNFLSWSRSVSSYLVKAGILLHIV